MQLFFISHGDRFQICPRYRRIETMKRREREIPYNYTSADDDQVISHLFGKEMLQDLEVLRSKRRTGRSARLLFRFMGDMFMIERNPFIFQELLDHPQRRNSFFKNVKKDLTTIEQGTTDPKVFQVIKECRTHLSSLSKRIKQVARDRKKAVKTLEAVTGPDSVYVDPFTLTAHTTDATDWRLYPPFAVVRPSDESQMGPLVNAIKELGLNIIPRGGGTGLTGGSVPLTRTCVMINTEKLDTIQGIRHETDPSGNAFACMDLDAGVITEDAMAFAKKENLVFATDPTSSWASTIGGNLAENAGGKTAVLWGTALDNILSYRIVMPSGKLLTVARQNHPLRKILPDDEVIFDVRDEKGAQVDRVILKGDEIRKRGLGKDVTNKTLNGLPGIQKEGCDGIITSATFILHPQYPLKKTFCLEFFGQDMTEAGKVITDISKIFRNRGNEACLIALEHFDEEYIKAIDYKAKAAGTGRLKAVLLIDMVANTDQELLKGEEKLEKILNRYQRTELTPARDEEEAERFWRDRKRLGAIAKRTNAFKLNEDIVLPIASLADFASYVDEYNLEEKRYTQQSLVKNLMAYLETAEPLEDPDWLVAKVSHARTLSEKTRIKIAKASRDSLERGTYAEEFYLELLEMLRGYTLVSDTLKKIYEETLARLIVIATHMHAGDGNVHVNIPVLSNDREMMKRASQTADDIMGKAVMLEGAVSGEHGIGVTKFAHLDPAIVEELSQYRLKIDPDGIMNPDKLSEPTVMERIFTPSFNLLGLEASILRYGSLGTLAANIANCVRCGRCKATCPVFFPQKNLFFHPRNKNLAVGALIEALLYVTQRTQSTQFRPLQQLEELADHCTICHKCHTQCPVNIDMGEVSVLEREILAEQNFKHTPLPTRLSLNYLATRNELKNAGLRKLLVGMGGTLQRTASQLVGALPDIKLVKEMRTVQMLKAPMPKVPGSTMRSAMPSCGPNQVILAEPEAPALHTVFYFPGCGSERLFSDIGKAAVYLLLKNRVRVILPPPYLCCGFPARVNAKTEQFNRLTLRDTIIFSQIRDMFNDLDFDACIISCGTCKESLENLDINTIFDCRVTDIARFVLGINQTLGLEENYLYHPPCHDSLEAKGADLLLSRSKGTMDKVPHCCSEAGTMAMSRPDISNAMLDRKKELIQTARNGQTEQIKMLTNCPSCLQGLGRNQDTGITPVHIACELAERSGGTHWEKEFRKLMKNSEVITF